MELLVLLGVFVVVVYFVARIGKSPDATSPAPQALTPAGPPSTTGVVSPWNENKPPQVPGTALVAAPPAPTRADLLAEIDKRYADELTPMTLRVGDLVPYVISDKSLSNMARGLADEFATLAKGNTNALGSILGAAQSGYLFGSAHAEIQDAKISRPLSDLAPAERATLRLADVLAVLGCLDRPAHLQIRGAIIWNEGKSLLTPGGNTFAPANRLVRLRQALSDLFLAHCGLATAAMERVRAGLRDAMDPAKGLPLADRQVLERFLTAGAAWLTPQDPGLTGLCPDPAAPSVLRLGVFPGTLTDLLYDRRESLATFAMPGAGKSMALVLRNLLYLKTPAVVLDIKGELAAASAAWRAANVGPVYIFAPRDPEHSVSFNPFARVSTDPDDAWEDCDKLAALLAVPTTNNAAGESYWDRRGRRVLASVLLEVALSEEGENRTMLAVRQRLARLASKEFLRTTYFPRLQALGVPDLLDLAAELDGLSDDQLPGLIDTARGYIQQWGAPRITRVTAADTFSPAKLRAENATLYLNIELEDVRRYASILRALLGQCIGHLCSGLPDRGAAPVTFFLDEFPQLGRFDEVARALDIGRGFGVRFWLFAQSIHHLSEAYANAEGMLGSCYVRSFINPTEADAQWLSRHLGERQGLLDGERKPLAEASDLAGARFADKLVCFIARSANAALETRNAYADPVCRQRMGLAD